MSLGKPAETEFNLRMSSTPPCTCTPTPSPLDSRAVTREMFERLESKVDDLLALVKRPKPLPPPSPVVTHSSPDPHSQEWMDIVSLLSDEPGPLPPPQPSLSQLSLTSEACVPLTSASTNYGIPCSPLYTSSTMLSYGTNFGIGASPQ